MPNKSRAETNIRITVAAGLFAIHTRDTHQIAEHLDTTERNVRRWAERDHWDTVLTTLNDNLSKGRKSQAETQIRITTAAGLFAFHTRDAKEIAEYLNTTERNIHRWAEHDRWKEVLQTLSYNGDLSFRVQKHRDTQRDAGESFQIAKDAYQQAKAEGKPKHTWASYAADAARLSRERVHKWAKRFHW